MRLNDLMSACEISSNTSCPDITITGLSCDSREMAQGNLFFALSGSKSDGAKFIVDAYNNGASAIVCSPNCPTDEIENIPIFYADDPRRSLSLAARQFYGPPPKTMVAITGTSGKTSVATFLHQLWRQHSIPSAMIGTTGVFNNNGECIDSTLTTPDPIYLHRTLAQLNEQGISHCVIEASSHGIEQRRLDAIEFAICAFTNLERDHLDYHRDLESYRQAKLRLFESVMQPSRSAILFADDPNTKHFISAGEKRGLDIKTIGYQGETIKLKNIESSLTGQKAIIQYEGTDINIDLPLIGEFQLTNALLAGGLAISLGLESSSVFSAMGKLQGVKGRLEYIGETSGAPCFVDYAHKPAALQNVLKTLRPLTTSRIILVFGCGGDRDKGKRKLMGEIADELSDYTIVTDDNPRTEDASEIRKAILSSCPNAYEIPDRKEAITAAMTELQQGDCLVVAGKGHEQGQIIGTEVLPFNDAQEILQLLQREGQ